MQHVKKMLPMRYLLAVIVALFMTVSAYAQSGFHIKEDVAPVAVAPKGYWGTLFFEVDYNGNEVSYQWYRTYKDGSKPDEKIEGATSYGYGPLDMKVGDVRFYYCIATYKGKSKRSKVGAVVMTGLPQLRVSTPNNVEITSKDTWINNAYMSLSYTEKDEWNFSASMSIRGRGNSTWGGAKKPYAIKLDSKQGIMGMPSHKRWVLMANYYDNSFLKNHMAFYLSEKFGMDYTVRGKFVDLFLNGEYKGLYWLGEAIKVDPNRVNIYDGRTGMSDSDDKDFLVEMDVYYDENPKFMTSRREMPYMIRNDDYMVNSNGAMTTGGQARLTRFQKKIENLEKLLYSNYVGKNNTINAPAPDERYSNIIDVDSWAKFWMINEIMDNTELGHPKSCYFTYRNDVDRFKAGPVWDFDWSSLNGGPNSLRNTIYYDALFKSPRFQTKVREIWNAYSGKIDLNSEIEKMREKLRAAYAADSAVWGIHYDPDKKKLSSYDAYVDFLKNTLNKKMDVVDKYISEELPGFHIKEDVAPVAVAPKGFWGTLFFVVDYDGNEVSYQWYRTYKDGSKPDEKIEGATSYGYGPFDMKVGDVRFFYCIATYKGVSIKSKVGAIVMTGLPQLFVSTPNNVEITSKETWINNANMSLSYAENNEWNFSASMSIRGRGNTTWGAAKKPYAIKLDSKQGIMGMPSHKRWVLIANYFDNSFLKNHMAFYLSEKFGMDYTVRGKFVDLFINGKYRGLYWLGEDIKVDPNRVNINDGYKGMSDSKDKDFLVEMDTHFDEPVKFMTPNRELPYMIKNDDYMVNSNGAMTTGGKARLARFQKKIENLEKLLYSNYVGKNNTINAPAPDERYSNIIDVDSWAKFWMINEIMDNGELQHPKSCYFTYRNDIDRFKAGPVWDFDWSSKKNKTYSLRGYIYYDALFKSPLFQAAVRRIWNAYSGNLDMNSEIEKMRKKLKAAYAADSALWGIHYDPDGVKLNNYDAYVDYLKTALNKKMGVVDKYISQTMPKVRALAPKIRMVSSVLEYSGDENRPSVTVEDEDHNVLKEDVDYTLTFEDNVDIGTAAIHLVGKGDYAGLKDTSFSIVPRSVVVTVDSLSKFYGEEDPELSYKVEGLLKSDSSEDVLQGVKVARQSGENAGEYLVSVVVDPDANPYYSVTVKDGVLRINPDTTEIVVSVKGTTDTVEYDGEKHSVQGIEMTSSNDAYSLDFVNYKGDSLVSGTDAKTYAMGLVAKDFKNTSGNYSNVVFDVTDGNLVITPKPAVVTVADASKTYGKKDPKLKYSVKGLVKVGGVEDSLEGVTLAREAGEDAGEYAINVSIDSAANSNYALSVEEGQFTIDPDTTEIVVTVKGHEDSVVYDGKKHSVRGFDMKSSLKAYSVDFVSYKGDSLASGTKAKTYAMGLVAKNFKNTSANYTNVVFEVEDGSLTIKEEEKKEEKKVEDKKEEKKEEKKKAALLAARISADLLKVYAMDRRIQVNSSMIGKRYAVYDMQGVVVQLGRVDAASFEIPVSKAGVYMVRVGSQTQRVNVK